MKKSTRTLVLMAVLVALMLLFGFTPIGYIPLPFTSLTLMCLPVIIGTYLLGLRAGFWLSCVFVLTSIVQLLTRPSALALILLDENPLLCVLVLIIPRLLIAFTAWGTMRAFGSRQRLGQVVGSAAGSLVNTFGYVLLVLWWFEPAVAAGYGISDSAASTMIWGIVLTNGLPEAALAAILCPVICRAVSKSTPAAKAAEGGRR